MASSQIDGSTADNIIVGSGPGVPSEVKVFRSDLPSQSGNGAVPVLELHPLSRATAPASASPPASSISPPAATASSPPRARQRGAGQGVRLLADDADRAEDQNAMPRAQAPRAKARPPTLSRGAGKPNLTAAFMPFGLDYRGGLSLATGWLAERSAAPSGSSSASSPARRSEGLFERLGARGRPGDVSRPRRPHAHRRLRRDGELHAVRRRRRRDVSPRPARRRRRPAGERSLGEGQGRAGSQIRALQALPQATNMLVKQLGTVVSATGSQPNVLGGDRDPNRLSLLA